MSRLAYVLSAIALAVPAPAEALPGYPPEQTYSLALHMHGSMSEMYGSMEWHTAKAESLGVDVIWWSDHDWRLDNARFMKRFDFETAIWEPFYLRWAENDEAWSANVRYWDAASATIVQTAIADTLSFEGSRSLLLQTAGQPGSQFSKGYLDQTTMLFNNRYSLAKRVSVSFAVYPENLDPVDARFVVEAELSDHPDGTKILRYVLGTMDGEEAHSTPLAFVPGSWNEYTLDVTADAIQHFSTGGADTLRAEDNSLGMVRIGLETRNGTAARVFFDDYRIDADAALVGDVLLNRARAIGTYYEGLYPNVRQYAGTEISHFLSQPHLNGFAPDLQLVDYTGHIWSDSITYAVDQIHEQDGVVSLNHVFGPRFDYTNNPNETPQQQAGRLSFWKTSLIGNRAFDVDVLEVGYRRRGGMDIEHHLELWDALNANAIWITGNGVTDSHGRGEHNLIGWGPDGSLSTTNNFVTWLHAEQPSEAGFVQALKRGRAYFGDPYAWQGDLDLRTADGFRMGQVVATDRDDHELLVEATNVPGDVQVRLLQAEIREDPPQPYKVVNYLRDEYLSGVVVNGTFADTVLVDTTIPSLIRIEVYDGSGEGLAYGNPIHFMRSVPLLGTPPERVAASLGDLRIFLADDLTLRTAAFDSVSQILTITGDEDPAGNGSVSIDPGALGAPAGVAGASSWTYVGGLLTLQGFSGTGSVVQVAWSATGAGQTHDMLRLRLDPGRPNPFGEGTISSYSLPHAGRVSLEVLDVTGRKVRLIESSFREAGLHRAWWDGRNDLGRTVASGVYYLRLRFAGETVHQKVVKLRR